MVMIFGYFITIKLIIILGTCNTISNNGRINKVNKV
jgi:hypothetical protein